MARNSKFEPLFGDQHDNMFRLFSNVFQDSLKTPVYTSDNKVITVYAPRRSRLATSLFGRRKLHLSGLMPQQSERNTVDFIVVLKSGKRKSIPVTRDFYNQCYSGVSDGDLLCQMNWDGFRNNLVSSLPCLSAHEAYDKYKLNVQQGLFKFIKNPVYLTDPIRYVRALTMLDTIVYKIRNKDGSPVVDVDYCNSQIKSMVKESVRNIISACYPDILSRSYLSTDGTKCMSFSEAYDKLFHNYEESEASAVTAMGALMEFIEGKTDGISRGAEKYELVEDPEGNSLRKLLNILEDYINGKEVRSFSEFAKGLYGNYVDMLSSSTGARSPICYYFLKEDALPKIYTKLHEYGASKEFMSFYTDCIRDLNISPEVLEKWENVRGSSVNKKQSPKKELKMPPASQRQHFKKKGRKK